MSDNEEPTAEVLDREDATPAFFDDLPDFTSLSVADRRRAAYREHADPIFFKWQRGEATREDWLDAVQAVKDSIT